MNERIKELALQAGLEMCGCGCNMPTRQSAKFAELILKDVVDICNKQKWQCSFQSYRDGINDVKHQIELIYGAKDK